jgi:hypothetical protein
MDHNVFFQFPFIIKSKLYVFYFNNFKILNVLKLLKNNNLVTNKFIIKHTCNSFLIIDNRNCFKFSKNDLWSVQTEYETQINILKTFPVLTQYLPDYQLLNIKTLSFLKYKKLNTLSKDNYLNIGIELYNKFNSCNLNINNNTIITKEVLEGLNLFSIYNKEIDIQCICNKLCENITLESITFGFCHGDFHYGNILVNNNSDFKIIDLDCIDYNGIQYFDAFYFLFEYEYLINKRTWINTVIFLLDNKLSNYFKDFLIKCNIEFNIYKLILFFLHRIGQESIKFNSFYKPDLINPCFDKIKQKLYD